MATLLEDPVLADLPANPSLRDVDTLIAVEKGSAMKLTVKKLDGQTLEVAVMNSATISDLKRAVENVVNKAEQSALGHRHISWSHVWGNFCLAYQGQRLVADNELLKSYGLRNTDTVDFMHYVPLKEAGTHSRAKRRRFFHGLRDR
eukprot:SM000100S09378  [mRNA]  locus=s100:75438:76642:+ [translate_table: standard]